MRSSTLYCSSTTKLSRLALPRRAQSWQCTTYVFLLLLSVVTNSRSNTSTWTRGRHRGVSSVADGDAEIPSARWFRSSERSPHRCCSNGPARSGSSRATPVTPQMPAAAPAASDTASASGANNTCRTETHVLGEFWGILCQVFGSTIPESPHLIISKSRWSDTLMFLAMFQERWIMGTMDLTLCSLFHS